MLQERNVLKRSGQSQPLLPEKLKKSILKWSSDLIEIDADLLAEEVARGAPDGITTIELNKLSSETAAQYITKHPNYRILAGRILMAKLHKETTASFVDTMMRLFKYEKNGKPCPLISNELMEITSRESDAIQAALRYERDMDYDYFAVRTLSKGYLMHIDGQIVERPQHMLMRVALGIHGSDVVRALQTYDLMSRRVFTHASPTLFNAGTPKPQLASCFLLAMVDDSIEGIYETLTRYNTNTGSNNDL